MLNRILSLTLPLILLSWIFSWTAINPVDETLMLDSAPAKTQVKTTLEKTVDNNERNTIENNAVAKALEPRAYKVASIDQAENSDSTNISNESNNSSDSTDVDSNSVIDTKIKNIMSEMNLQEKAAQMIIVYHSPSSYMLKHQYGGSLVMAPSLRKSQELKEDIAIMQAKMKIPVLITTDQEGGSVDRLSKLKDMDPMKAASEIGLMTPNDIVEYTKPWAKRLNDLGINTNLAPVLDPAHDWQDQETFMFHEKRSFSADKNKVIKSANAFMDGFKTENIICITKHFPGYDVQTNSDHDLAHSHADSAEVAKNIEVFAKTASKAGGVMMTSIQFNNFSDKPAVFDSKIVQWARDIFPDAIIMTDDLWGTALRAYAADTTEVGRSYSNENLKKLTMLAFDAGNDMLMMTYPAMAEKMIKMITAEAKRNPKRKAILNQAVYRILKVKINNGIIK